LDKKPRKILIVGPAWVGDMVMAQTLFKVLKEQRPDDELHVLAPAWSQPLLDRMPEISKGIVLPFGHGDFNFHARKRLGRSLVGEHYDQAILCTNSWKSALVPYFAKIPVRTSWRGECRYGLINDLRVLDKTKYPLMVERFMALAFPRKMVKLPEQTPVPAFECQAADIDAALLKYQLTRDKPILALCPGAEFGPSKRWPETYYADVARQKISEGWQVWLFGSPKDQEVAVEIQKLTNDACIDLTGKTQLPEAIDLLSIVDAGVCNDSGLMHIAAALGRPLVVPYGSTSPDFTPPLSKKVKVLRLGLECSPCFKRECPLGHHKCMTGLDSQRVLRALNEV
jgi:heptosyltransferase II